jgi:hypothetical protein
MGAHGNSARELAEFSKIFQFRGQHFGSRSILQCGNGKLAKAALCLFIPFRDENDFNNQNTNAPTRVCYNKP